MRRRHHSHSGRAGQAEKEAGTEGQGWPPHLPVAALFHLAAAAPQARHGLRNGEDVQQGVYHRFVIVYANS